MTNIFNLSREIIDQIKKFGQSFNVMKTLAIIYAFLIAPSLASFLAVYVERGKMGESLLGRSHCICGKIIPWYLNIPIFTYLTIKGKARCCGSTIPIWYLYYEVVALLIAVPLTFFFSFYGLILALLIEISIAVVQRYKKS